MPTKVIGCFRVIEYATDGICGACDYQYNAAPISRCVAFKRANQAINHALSRDYIIDVELFDVDPANDPHRNAFI